jgi:hypothetical protein
MRRLALTAAGVAALARPASPLAELRMVGSGAELEAIELVR